MSMLMIILLTLIFIGLLLCLIMTFIINSSFNKIYDNNLMLTYNQIRKYHYRIEVCEKIKFMSSIVLFFVFLGFILLLVI